MKTLILLLAASVIFLSSCSNPKPDESKTTFQLSSQNNQHWDNGKLVDDSVAVISPTFGQAVYYAKESGYGGQKLIAFAFLAAFAGLLALLGLDKIQMGRGPGFLMFIALSGFLGFMFGKPSAVWLNNKKQVPIEQYRKAIEETGSTQVIWDGLYKDNKIINAASK